MQVIGRATLSNLAKLKEYSSELYKILKDHPVVDYINVEWGNIQKAISDIANKTIGIQKAEGTNGGTINVKSNTGEK